MNNAATTINAQGRLVGREETACVTSVGREPDNGTEAATLPELTIVSTAVFTSLTYW
jgi:hypothetical protein